MDGRRWRLSLEGSQPFLLEFRVDAAPVALNLDLRIQRLRRRQRCKHHVDKDRASHYRDCRAQWDTRQPSKPGKSLEHFLFDGCVVFHDFTARCEAQLEGGILR